MKIYARLSRNGKLFNSVCFHFSNPFRETRVEKSIGNIMNAIIMVFESDSINVYGEQ